MSKYWSEIAKKIDPYVPGEQPRGKKYIKLNTNESPYPPSPRVIEAIRNAADSDLRLYPDPDCNELREVIAQYHGLKKEQVFIGNGSDELLAFSFMAYFNPGKPILFPDITYSFYPVYAKLYNIDYIPVPLDEDFNVPVEPFLKENGGIVISNPKAPTAKVMPLDEIETILKHNEDQVVIIDEAYIDFGGESAVRLIDKYPNLLIIQTLSKSRCLAGLRVGFAMGNKELMDGINRIKNCVNSYTIDRIALAGAAEAIRDEAYFMEIRDKIIRTRENVVINLKELGFRVTDSAANFVFVSHPFVHAAAIYKELRDKGILVRYFKLPRIDNYLRISIGTDEEMNSLTEALKEIIKK